MASVTTWFPVIGLLVGAMSGVVWMLAFTVVSPLSASAIATMTGVIITGAFHHDGLADSMDGLVGGWTSEQRRQILKDSRHGTYGVMAIVLQIVLQVSLLSEFSSRAGFIALTVAHCLGRTSAVWMMKTGVGLSEGLGASYVADVQNRHIFLSSLSCFLVLGVLVGIITVPVVIAVGFTVFIFSQWAIRKIGGIVGDVLGAAEQIGESVALLVLVIFFRQGFEYPWW